MPSINLLIYTLGLNDPENKGLDITEINKLIGDDDKDYRRAHARTTSVLKTYPQFFKKEEARKGNRMYVWRLVGRGKTAYEEIKDIYDPVTDTMLVPRIKDYELTSKVK